MPGAEAGVGSFELTKWYFDVVDPLGTSALAYWTVLRWGPLLVRWEGLSLHGCGCDVTHRGAFGGSNRPHRKAASPEVPQGEIEWHSRGLRCGVRCRPWVAPHRARLLDAADGCVDWLCEAPAATMEMSIDGLAAPLRLAGAGYAEQITLTIPPWKLPISELRWGRWSCAASRRSIAWIDWRGDHPLTLVLCDGVPCHEAAAGEDRVGVDGADLLLADTRVLHSRTLFDIVGGLGGLAARLPKSWRNVEDRKSLSTGVFAGDKGWAIHETVRFP